MDEEKGQNTGQTIGRMCARLSYQRAIFVATFNRYLIYNLLCIVAYSIYYGIYSS